MLTSLHRFALALAIVLGAAAPAHAADRMPMARRSTEARNLSTDDRARLAELGVRNPTAAVVIVRHVTKSAHGGELARLRAIARAPAELAPSGACDALTPRGDARAFCAGHVDGPIGRVPARMPISSTMVEGANGALELIVRNSAALEVKPLLSWSAVVAPNRLVISYALEPDTDGWRITTRIGIEMLAHADSAKTIAETLLKLDSWLTRDLAAR